MPEPRIRRLHTRRARPGPAAGEAVPSGATPSPTADLSAGLPAEGPPDAGTPVEEHAVPAVEPEQQLAPEEAESAEAEAAVLAAGDVAGDGETEPQAEEPGAVEAAAVAGALAAAAVAGEQPAEAEPGAGAGEREAGAEETEPEGAEEPAEEGAEEAEPEGAEESPREEAEPEGAEEPAEEGAELEGSEAAAEPTAEAVDGWFREASLDEGPAVEGVDLDGWPSVAATGAAGLAEGEVQADEQFIRDRDRPVATVPPAGEPPRPRGRLQQFLLAVLTIVAVAVVGFVAGMMLPVIFPGPGIEPGTAAPSPAASNAATPAPTSTAEPSPTPTVAPTPTPEPSPTPTPAPTPLIHVVQPGDQLGRIAARYGVTVAAIVAANDLANPNLIRVGQRLVIPLPEASPAP